MATTVRQVSGGIKALSRAILDDTKGEANRIVSEAHEAAERILQQARQEGDRTRRDILSEAESEISHLEQQAMATARLEAQRIMLASREEMIDEVFRQADAHLQEIRERDDYPAVLRDLIVDAVERLGQPREATVRVAARDEELITDELLQEAEQAWKMRVKLHLGQPVDIKGGVIVEAAEGQKRTDNSLHSRLQLERARLRAEVYRRLQGEA